MNSISSVVSSHSTCTTRSSGKFKHVVHGPIYSLFFIWASIVATHFVICICIKVQYLCDITASLIFLILTLDLYAHACLLLQQMTKYIQIYPVYHPFTYIQKQTSQRSIYCQTTFFSLGV